MTPHNYPLHECLNCGAPDDEVVLRLMFSAGLLGLWCPPCIDDGEEMEVA